MERGVFLLAFAVYTRRQGKLLFALTAAEALVRTARGERAHCGRAYVIARFRGT